MKKNKSAFLEYLRSTTNTPEIKKLKKERKSVDKKDKKDKERLKDIDAEIGRLIREARGDKKLAEIKRELDSVIIKESK